MKRSLNRTSRVWATALTMLGTVAILIAGSPLAQAAATTYTWGGSSGGDWAAASNWSPSTAFPISGDTAYIDSGTVNIGATSGTCTTLYLGHAASSSGALSETSGGMLKIAAASNTYIGYGGTGTYTQTGGSNSLVATTLGYLTGSSGSYTQTGGTANTTNLIVGGGSSTSSYGTGSYSLSNTNDPNASLTVSGGLTVGNYGTGTFTLNSGIVTVTTGITIGQYATGAGTITQNGGLLNETGTASYIYIGQGTASPGGAGTYNLKGGTLTINENCFVGSYGPGAITQGTGSTFNVAGAANLSIGANNSATPSASYTMSGGILNIANSLTVGYKNSGTFTQSDGTIQGTGAASALSLGYGSGGTGTFNMSAGTISMVTEQACYANGATGVFNQLGGLNTISGTTTTSGLVMVRGATSTAGTYNLAGGTLALQAMNKGSGTITAATFNFGGGTLQATGSFTSVIPMNLATGSLVTSLGTTTLPGVATIDTQSNAVTLSGILSGLGALTKIGNGTLVLSGVNNYTGLTTVSAGTLQYGINNAVNTGNVQVSGGTLDLNGFAGTVGAVTLSGSAIVGGTLTGTSFAVQGGTASAILDGSGATLTKSGPGTVILSTANTYTGLTTVSAGTLQLGDGTNNGSVAGDIVNNATLAFNVAASTSPTYGGAISGSGALTKTGAGTLTLSGANSYHGETTVGVGTLSLAQACLYDTSNVRIESSAVLNLNYTGGTDTIGALFLGGVQQFAGLYDSSNSGGYITNGASSALNVTVTVTPGDANRDGSVDGSDLNIVLSNYGTTSVATWGMGDFNNDHHVDGSDLNIVLSNYGSVIHSTAAVPEPAALGLLALGAIGLLAYVWRKK